jgi:hypothetical protein
MILGELFSFEILRGVELNNGTRDVLVFGKLGNKPKLFASGTITCSSQRVGGAAGKK